jgi:hypothetical protein
MTRVHGTIRASIAATKGSVRTPLNFNDGCLREPDGTWRCACDGKECSRADYAGHSGGQKGTKMDTGNRLERVISELRAADPTLTEAQAYVKACHANPGLYGPKAAMDPQCEAALREAGGDGSALRRLMPRLSQEERAMLEKLPSSEQARLTGMSEPELLAFIRAWREKNPPAGLDAAIKALKAADPRLSDAAAFVEACRRNPSLYVTR